MSNIIRRREGLERSQPATGVWDPWRVMRSMLEWDPFERMAEMAPYAGERMFAPTFDVKETGDSYIFRADLPGVKEDDLDISLTGNRLTVSGKREMEERKEGERYFAFERSYGSFTRTFTLPEGIDSESVRAEMKDGVLTLTVPKKPEVQPKKISVKPGQARSPGAAKA